MKLVLIFILISLGAVFALAQEQAIGKGEFDRALNGTGEHKTLWQGQLYRITLETSARIADRPDSDYSSRSLFEFGPARKSRRIYTCSFGGKTTTEETLRLGDLSYTRTNGGSWTTSARSSTGPGAEIAPAPADPQLPISSDETFYLVGRKPYKGATATVYRKVETKRKTNAATSVESVSVCTSVYWLVDGVQRKYDLTCENRSTDLNSTNVINTQWDLDPTIMFNAPYYLPTAAAVHFPVAWGRAMSMWAYLTRLFQNVK